MSNQSEASRYFEAEQRLIDARTRVAILEERYEEAKRAYEATLRVPNG